LNLEENQNNEKCLYCDEIFSNPLPLKVLKYLHDIKTGEVSANTAVEQIEFCRIHHGEKEIIPYGIKKKYPLDIDFINLPNRILNMKSEILKVIRGQKYSEYCVNAIKKIQEIG
ncbi:12223_t:CDS:2, partial [Dentiscutata erythropus]